MDPQTFNVNDAVQVQLTPYGEQLVQQRGWTTYRADAEGWTTFQLHTLMWLFGQEMYHGNTRLPFKPTIRLCPREP